MKKIRTIRLYGKLGAKFGRVHRLAVNSTREAMRALCSMVPGFEHELMNSADRGIAYACFIGKKNIGADQLSNPIGDEDIRIAPILQGSKQAGLLQTILGIVLIVVGVFVSGYDGGTTLALGISMTAGGVIQMLSPQQTGLGAKDNPNNGASYNFNGAVNTEAQGGCEPICYGETWTGSVVGSGSITSRDH